ncbi:MAG: hypothetical protein IJR83_03195 [Clostridia bacterium]|nr:hypothetical protein [Clostridia bacterium]
MKNKLIQILSVFLTCLMVFGSVTAILTTQTFAAEQTQEEIEAEAYKALTEKDYVKEGYKSAEDKLATMKCYLTKGDYSLYFQQYTGEFAIKDEKTGEFLLSNPFDVATSIGSETTKQEILSQILVRFIDTSGAKKTFTSYKEACLREQISIQRIKNGVRVEYIMGDENSRRLVPRMITTASFEENLAIPVAKALPGGRENFWFKKLTSGYVVYDLEVITSDTFKKDAIRRFPVLEQVGSLMVFDQKATTRLLNDVENVIKTYAPEYTFEQLEIDHAEVGYDSSQDVSPVFKMALEYSINEDGFTVRLPANGIRFNSSLYTLESISILPYFGAGNSANPGYNFYPDGSGALFEYEKLNGTQTTTVKNPIYGTDYAYTLLSGKYQRAIRYPVYGIRETATSYTYRAEVTTTDKNGKETRTEDDYVYSSTTTNLADLKKKIAGDSSTILLSDITEVKTDKGFFAIIEQGETMAELATYHAGSTSDYNTMMTYFLPRPKDTFRMNDSLSVSGTTTWTQSSNRKYTGNFVIRYIMLHDETKAESAGLTNYFTTDYVAMAQAYRNYLENKGILTRLTDTDVTENIPLYIDSFGAMDYEEHILSVPVNVKKPLTTFTDIITMYEELKAEGINNVKFQLTGFTNGGLISTMAYRLKWVGSVGGKSGFKKLLAYADTVSSAGDGSSLGIYPDFDFVWMCKSGAFDGVSLKRDAIKGINDRYRRYREYSPSYQSYISTGMNIAISPGVYERFYTKLTKNYLKTGATNISVSTLGYILNSDFDSEEPYNRNDSMEFVQKAFSYFDEQYSSVMTNGGNLYTWAYTDYIVDAPLTSSKYTRASKEVPFFGIVTHGYLQYAGSAANMEGNMTDAVLKAIESGSSLYYILSYRNTSILKDLGLYSKYYSISYDIWREDVIASYNTVNDAIKDVQTKLIINHEFVKGNRVPDEDETLNDLLQAYLDAMEAERLAAENSQFEKIKSVNDARANALLSYEWAETALAFLDKRVASSTTYVNEIVTYGETYKMRVADYNNLSPTATSYEKQRAETNMNSAKSKLLQAIKRAMDEIASTFSYKKSVPANYQQLTDAVAVIDGIEDILPFIRSEVDNYKAEVDAMMPLLEADLETLNALLEQAYANAYATGLEERDVASVAPSETDDSGSGESGEEGEEEIAFNKYEADDAKIVAVTYGGKNGVDNAPYKTIILNYNSYSVEIEYEGVLYTIPSNEFVIIKW